MVMRDHASGVSGRTFYVNEEGKGGMSEKVGYRDAAVTKNVLLGMNNEFLLAG